MVNYVHGIIFWIFTRIYSGGSKVSDKGAPIVKMAVSTYYLPKKAEWKWKKLDWEGGGARPRRPLPVSAKDLISGSRWTMESKGINTPSGSGSGSFEVLMLGLTLENGGGDRFSSVTMYSNGSGNTSINASVAADARCGLSLRHHLSSMYCSIQRIHQFTRLQWNLMNRQHSNPVFLWALSVKRVWNWEETLMITWSDDGGYVNDTRLILVLQFMFKRHQNVGNPNFGVHHLQWRMLVAWRKLPPPRQFFSDFMDISRENCQNFGNGTTRISALILNLPLVHILCYGSKPRKTVYNWPISQLCK